MRKWKSSHHSSAPSSVEKQNHVTLWPVPRGNITTLAVALGSLGWGWDLTPPSFLPSFLPSLLQGCDNRHVFLCWDHLDMAHRLSQCSYDVWQFVPLTLSISFKLAVYIYLSLSSSCLGAFLQLKRTSCNTCWVCVTNKLRHYAQCCNLAVVTVREGVNMLCSGVQMCCSWHNSVKLNFIHIHK